MATHDFKNLFVWQKGMELVVQVYDMTNKLPASEKYGLTDQMRRSAVSIPSNIAEGQKRNGRAEAAHFSGIALGSCAELETQFIILSKIYEFDVSKELFLCAEVAKMLTALIKSLRPKNATSKVYGLCSKFPET